MRGSIAMDLFWVSDAEAVDVQADFVSLTYLRLLDADAERADRQEREVAGHNPSDACR